MIALDTNVLLRLLLGDDARQEAAAARVFAGAARSQTPVYVADAVLCELVWVCRARYGLDRDDTARILTEVLRTERIVVEDPAGAARAVEAYRDGRADFADYLIRARAEARGATEVVTFDRALKTERGYRLIG